MSLYSAFGDYIKQNKTVEKFNANTNTIIINNNVLIAKHHPKNFGKSTIHYK